MSFIYTKFDLGAFDPELAGTTVDILENPLREMYRSFLSMTGSEFKEALLIICNVADWAAVNAIYDRFDVALFQWLFIPRMIDKKLIYPAVYKVWDAYTEKRIKALSDQPVLSGEVATSEPLSD